MREDNDPITEASGRLVTTLDVIGLEAFVPEPPRGPGRPPENRRALARAFVAKAVLGVLTTSALIERLDGWERRSQVPSEATFSRPFAKFSRGALPDKIHAALIERALGGHIIGAIARDATEIEAREKPVQNTANDGKDDPPAPDNPAPPRKRGRPRKDEQRPRPEPTRLKRQVTQNLSQMENSPRSGYKFTSLRSYARSSYGHQSDILASADAIHVTGMAEMAQMVPVDDLFSSPNEIIG